MNSSFFFVFIYFFAERLNPQKIEAEGHGSRCVVNCIVSRKRLIHFLVTRMPEIAIIVVNIKTFYSFLSSVRLLLCTKKIEVKYFLARICNHIRNDGRQQCFAFNIIHISVFCFNPLGFAFAGFHFASGIVLD